MLPVPILAVSSMSAVSSKAWKEALTGNVTGEVGADLSSTSPVSDGKGPPARHALTPPAPLRLTPSPDQSKSIDLHHEKSKR